MKWYEQRPICNKNPSSAPTINGKKFIFCWRCTGAIVGAAVCSGIMLFAVPRARFSALLLCCLFAVPAVVDFYLPKFTCIKPSNKRRAVTGVLLGFGVCAVIDIAIRFLAWN